MSLNNSRLTMKKNAKMGARKGTRKMSAPRTVSSTSKEKKMDLRVQLNEPQSVRKDILEALREIIIFMQGYETFMKIQEEKIAAFGQLRENVKEMHGLVHDKLRRHLPKGKLKGYVPEQQKEAAMPEERKMEMPPSTPSMPRKEESRELDDLEQQLQDIEDRLKNLS